MSLFPIRPLKRAHDSMSVSQASSELMASLSSSLHKMLVDPATDPSQSSRWLEQACEKVGVGSNVAAIKFLQAHGRDHDEQFHDVRYLVWVSKHVLLATRGDADSDELASFSLEALQSWQDSMAALIKDGGDADEMGVMWQLLLRCLNLTPEQLKSAYHRALENNPNINNADDISYCSMWPSFLRGVVGEANNTNKRRKSNHGNDGFFSSSRQQQTATQQPQFKPDKKAWLPLLGYTITHATFYSFNDYDHLATNIQQKIHQVQTAIFDSLPCFMGIPSYDTSTKQSLLGGMVACILDVIGEGYVLGSMSLDDEDEGSGVLMGGEASLDLNYNILGVGVDQLVDLLLSSGSMPSLAKSTKTPLANLVSEAAEMILFFSKVRHRLQQRTWEKNNNTDDNSLTIDQLIQGDASKVVQFIAKANPQLFKQFSNQVFIPSDYLSTESVFNSELPPMHPMTVYIRALLVSGQINDVASICLRLEECTGLELSVKLHSWMLLLERMKDGGTLINDGSPPSIAAEGEKLLTLRDLKVGKIGHQCVVEYLGNIVLVAREKLYPNQRGTSRAREELRCLKDAVRKTCLKFLMRGAYSFEDALKFSNKVSDAGNDPELEDKSHNNTSMKEVERIIKAKLLYEVFNENLDAYDDDEEEEEEEEEEQAAFGVNEEEALDEDGPVDMSVDQIGTPFVDRTSAEEENEPPSPDVYAQSASKSPPESLKKVKRWQQIQSSTKKNLQFLRNSESASPSSPELPASNLDDVQQEKQEEIDEDKVVEEEEVIEENAEDLGEESDQVQKVDETEVNHDHTSSEEDAIDEEEYDSDATKSIGAIDESDAVDEEDLENEEERETGGMAYQYHDGEEEEEETEEVTYPRHYHEYVGNYSESDDYDKEDEEEADRHVAFHEPAGDASEADSPEVVDLLDDSSSESDDDPDAQPVMDEKSTSSNEEQDEGEMLNESVNEYLAAHDNDQNMSDDNDHDTDQNMADDEHDTEASQQGGTFDDGEVSQGSPRINRSILDENVLQPQQQPSVLVAAAMSSQRQSAVSNIPLNEKPLVDNISYDDTSAARASADDNLSEYYDETSNVEGDDIKSNVEVVAHEHGAAMEIDSALNAHADAIDSIDETGSNNPEDKNTEGGQSLMTDDGYDAEVSEVEQTTLDGITRPKAADDDGYLPDAEVSEVEQSKTKKLKPTMDDEGYVPDGGHTTGGEEASEVEQGDDSNKKTKRDVRFEVEANLETTIAPSESLAVEPATNLSTIDDGYLPTDDGLTEEEKGPTAKSLAIPATSVEDEGYIPDSGAITEEERLENERKRRRYMDSEDAGYVPDGHTTAGEGEGTDVSQTGPDDMNKSPPKSVESRDDSLSETKDSLKSSPSTEIMEDVVDKGYIPSAAEGTEEERSEEEGAKFTGEAPSSDIQKESTSFSGQEPAIPSVLVATATVLQQGGSEAGDIAQRASLPMKDAGAGNGNESYSSEGSMSDGVSTEEVESEEVSPPLGTKMPSRSDQPTGATDDAVEIEIPEKETLADPNTLPNDEGGDMNENSNKMEVESPAENVVASLDDSGDAGQDSTKIAAMNENESFIDSKLPGDEQKKEEDVEEEQSKMVSTMDAPNPPDSQDNEEGTESEDTSDDDSLGSKTVVTLKKMCREQGLKVGGNKKDLVERIREHDAAKKPASKSKKRSRGRSSKNPLGQALEEHNKSIATQAKEAQKVAGSSSKASSTRMSARLRSSKNDPSLDTPVSALTHGSDSESDDDDETKSVESGTHSMTRRSGRRAAGQNSIPTDIVTRGNKSLKLPVLPEGETFEDNKKSSKPAAVPLRRSKRSSASVTSGPSATESIASRVSRRRTKGKNSRLPNLKSFLKEGEAESYENVEVKYVPGRKAVLTIYESVDGYSGRDHWVEKEQVVLSHYKTKEEMHALMAEKGFKLKPPEEIEAIQKKHKTEAEAEQLRREEKRRQRQARNNKAETDTKEEL